MVRNQLIDNLSPSEVLGLTIIGEARGEPIEGQVAVGCVIRNRIHDNPGKFKSYSDVCLEEKQFSCWNLNDRNYPVLLELAAKLIHGEYLEDPYLRQCVFVAKGVESWAIADNTHGAKNYLELSLYNDLTRRPHWAMKSINPVFRGKQVFFNV